MANPTIAALTVSNQWFYLETTGELRIFSNETFDAQDGQTVLARGDENRCFYKSTLTISGDDITIPQITTLPPNTVSNVTGLDPRYTAEIWKGTGENAALAFTFLSDFRLPPSPTPTTWALIREYNNLPVNPSLVAQYATANYVNAAIDAAITDPSSLANLFINVTDAPYNAVDDGVTDNTTTLQAALDAAAAAYKILLFPPGTYMTGRLLVPSNTHIHLLRGATLLNKPTSAFGDSILFIRDKSNITIDGFGTIDGNRDNVSSPGLTPIIVNGVSHLVMRDITITGASNQTGNFGDGMYILEGYATGVPSSDILIDGVIFDRNARNGMQIGAVNRMIVTNCTFKNTSPVDGWLGPSAGIDVEITTHEQTTVNDITTVSGDNTVTSVTTNFNTIRGGGALLPATEPYLRIYRASNAGLFITKVTAINSDTSIEVQDAPNFNGTGLTAEVVWYGIKRITNLNISDNVFADNDGGGLIVNGHPPVPMSNLLIANNVVTDCPQVGIGVNCDQWQGVTVIGNQIGRTDGVGLTVSNSGAGVNIQGNTVWESSEEGVDLGACAKFNFTGNTVINSGRHGISIRTDTVGTQNGVNGIIADNQIWNNGTSASNTYDGINITGRPTDQNVGIRIRGNQIGNDGFVGNKSWQRYAINLSDTNTRNVQMVLNDMIGNLSGKVSANTSAQTAPRLEFTDFSTGLMQSLVLSNGYDDNNLTASSIVSREIRPTQISGQQNNSTMLVNGGYLVNFDCSGSIDFTGFESGQPGETHLGYVWSGTVVLKHQNASSAAKNRIITHTGADVSYAAGSFFAIEYSKEQLRWLTYQL